MTGRLPLGRRNVGARRLPGLLAATLAAWLCGCGTSSSPNIAVPADIAAADVPPVTVTDSAADSGVDLGSVPGPDVPAGADSAASDVPIDPGQLGAPCKEAADCNSGYCVASSSGKMCTVTCSGICPASFSCQILQTGSDATSVCLPRFVHLCEPCKQDADCKDAALGGTQLCVPYGNDGSFCGTMCSDDSECPKSYVCLANQRAGQTVGQCRRIGGQCECTDNAKAAKLQTSCGHSTAYGTCTGSRQCGATGLTACNAAIPSAEVCNGQDDNCDGQTDEGIPDAPCSLSNAFGVCSGVLQCQEHKPVCVGSMPSKELCNGKDDNCNGAIDDKACDDGNPCTEDACNVSLGGCVFAQVDKPCDDGDVCTMSDTCHGGVCKGDAVPCDDKDPCTVDSCASSGANPGCLHKLQSDGPCDDGDACTGGDHCIAGANAGQTLCVGVALADGLTCTDGDPCTATADCVSGKCTVKTSVCDDGNPCTDDACASNSGAAECKHMYNIAICDDGNPCTIGDTCFAGTCGGLGKAKCDDLDPCTADTCDAASGGCKHTAQAGSSCTDNNICTTGDACAVLNGVGLCQGTTLTCDDGNPCTSDDCNPAFGCEHAFVVAGCDDGDPCTQGDKCITGQCVSGEYTCGECVTNADCKAKEDGNFCNGTLYCEKQGHTCIVNPATIVTCPAPVGAGSACLKSTCQPASGTCVVTPTNASGVCDDGNICTSGDICKNGVCIGNYGTTVCDDNNACTTDVCDAVSGCLGLPLDGGTCNDGNVCTLGDACKAGKCISGPALACDDGNPCTTDGCNAAQGCIHNQNSLPCNDGNVCTDGDLCKFGVCTPTKSLNCDDGNFCTTDSCDPMSGCAHVSATGIACNDGNACTSGDKCIASQCIGPGSLPCNDGNPCTDDLCNPASGCTFVPNTSVCSDGNACTDGDACQGGACKSGKTLNCNDTNTCTIDLCDPAAGCTYTKMIDGQPCSDNDACTANDACQAGACKPGTPVLCNDGQSCTTDTCSHQFGCVYTALSDGAACDDNNFCTPTDTCKTGICVGTGMIDKDKDGHVALGCLGGDDCDDNNPNVNPGAPEVCDDLDDDCNGQTDEGCDDDNDDYCDANMVVPIGVVPSTCTQGGGDCNDTNPNINPGATEKLDILKDHEVQGTGGGVTPVLGGAVAADGTMYLALVRNISSGIAPSPRLFVYSKAPGDIVWTAASVDDAFAAGGASATSSLAMVVDATGQPHVAYQAGAKKTLRHAVRKADGWAVEDVDLSQGVGDWISIAAAPSGTTVHIAYYDGVGGDLKYANNALGVWTLKLVDASNDVGRYASIGVDKSGFVHIAYQDNTNQDLRYANNTTGNFVAQTLDGTVGVNNASGFFSCLALDSLNHVHIAYYELIGSDLHYASNASGIWKTETVDSTGTVGQNPTIAVDINFGVHIAYLDVTNGNLKYVTGQSNAWGTKVVVGSAIADSQPKLMLQGLQPYVAYESFNGFANVFNLAKKNAGGTFDAPTLPDAGLGSPPVSSASFAGRRSGTPNAGDVMLLGNSTVGQVVARWTGKGYEWRAYPSAPAVAPYSMALDSNGYAHGCGVLSSGGLGYVRGSWAGGFSTLQLDASNPGGPCAIAVDANNYAHIVYYDTGNKVLRYLNVKSGVASATQVPDPTFNMGTAHDIAITGNTIVAAYAGAGLRVATSTGGAWSVTNLSSVPTSHVALAIDTAGVKHLFYMTPLGAAQHGKLLHRQTNGAFWGAENVAIDYAGEAETFISATTDAAGNAHAAVNLVAGAAGSELRYVSNQFGAWTSELIGTAYRAPLAIAVSSVGRVFLSSTYDFGGNSQVDVSGTFTYQHLIDYNCDGK